MGENDTKIAVVGHKINELMVIKLLKLIHIFIYIYIYTHTHTYVYIFSVLAWGIPWIEDPEGL